jgi:hypothetical protein
MTVFCSRDGCDQTWPRDPVLEVECPSCGAAIGTKCKRPSGHGGNFVHPHGRRDRLAVDEGHYGTCPLDICAESLEDMDRPDTPIDERGEPTKQASIGSF